MVILTGLAIINLGVLGLAKAEIGTKMLFSCYNSCRKRLLDDSEINFRHAAFSVFAVARHGRTSVML